MSEEKTPEQIRAENVQLFKQKLQDVYGKATKLRDCGELLDTTRVPSHQGNSISSIDGKALDATYFTDAKIKELQNNHIVDCRAELAALLTDLDALITTLGIE